MKALPIGIQEFAKLRSRDCLYIDKTEIIYKLVSNSESAYFLSRPRRFGKSLLISTLEEIFTGNKELFKGLWIEQSDYAWESYPVIRIDFSKLSALGVRELLLDLKLRLKGIGTFYEIPSFEDIILNDVSLSFLISSLIEELYNKLNKRVVILIDEYDSPIISNIQNEEQLDRIREHLAGFYRAIKGSDKYLRFVFLTGVSKFAKVSVFSGLNNLLDITLDPDYATILGYTQQELETYFVDRLEKAENSNGFTRSELLENLRLWYNGYRFSEIDERVYNPFSILLFFKHSKFSNYWFETGTPTFLLKLLEQNNYYVKNLEHSKLQDVHFASYEPESIPLIPLLYHTGYLTISCVSKESDHSLRYEMCYPNYEVRNSFLHHLLSYLTGNRTSETDLIDELLLALKEHDLDKFILVVKTIFCAIPYDSHPRNPQVKHESYYQSLLYAMLKVAGMQISSEERTNRGRVDLVIESKDAIYIFEIKLDKRASEAIAQIKKRGYAEKYSLQNKKTFLIGLSFSSKERNISEYEIEEVR